MPKSFWKRNGTIEWETGTSSQNVREITFLIIKHSLQLNFQSGTGRGRARRAKTLKPLKRRRRLLSRMKISSRTWTRRSCRQRRKEKKKVMRNMRRTKRRAKKRRNKENFETNEISLYKNQPQK